MITGAKERIGTEAAAETGLHIGDTIIAGVLTKTAHHLLRGTTLQTREP